MRKIPIIAGISIVIIIIIFAARYDVSPDKKELEISDNAQVQPTANDTVSVTDLAGVTKNGAEFHINNEGKKVYVISAVDAPNPDD